MTRMSKTYFEDLYRRDPDPWGLATRWYEARKYAITMAALPRPRYRSGFEPGCSIGMLTAMLATRCDHLLAADGMPVAAEQARARTWGLANVEVADLTVPESWPEINFDLVVLSEIAYYFDPEELGSLLDRVRQTLDTAGGHLMAVHWRGTTNYPLTGDHAHQLIGSRPELARVVHHVEDEFVLDVWEPRSPPT